MNFHSKSSYPQIILHDCVVEGIAFEQRKVVLSFDDEGFWVSGEHPMNPYGELLRTGVSEIHYSGVDYCNSWADINIDYYLFGKHLITIQKRKSIGELSELLAERKWKLAILEEYYLQLHVLLCGYISTPKRSRREYSFQLKVHHTDREYCWDKIFEERYM